MNEPVRERPPERTAVPSPPRGEIFWREGVAPEPPGRLVSSFARVVGRLYLAAARLAERATATVRGPARPLRSAGEIRILAVGPFYSGNWVAAHLHAMGETPEISEITVITPEPYRSLPKVRYHVPPAWLQRLAGMSVARAFAALRLAVKQRPDIVIGYHAPWNGIVGLLAGRLCRARTAYFSVGGPAEIIGGGLYSEHALFRRIGREDARLETRFLSLINRFDSVLTMGSGSAGWFRDAGVRVPVWPMGAGVDGAAFGLRPPAAAEGPGARDFVTVARLAPIKRLDLLVRAIARLRDEGDPRTAVIVGEGADRPRLEALIAELGLEANVSLAGFQSNVEDWLEPARLFVMTSASEGLPLAIIEAMLCGLPVVAPAVGDIPDLVENGEHGFLFTPGDPDSCVAALRAAVSAPDPRAMGARARARALDYTVEARAALWSKWLASQRDAGDT